MTTQPNPEQGAGDGLTTAPLEELQRDVHRLLGQCVLRLQQYELYAKALVAHSELSGSPATLQSNHDANVASAATKTLGQLMGELTGRSIVHPLAVQDEDSEKNPPPEPEEHSGAHLRARFAIQIPAESYSGIVQGMVELVRLRNELVHHFIERFHLGTPSGCRAASAHLQECSETINVQFAMVKRWVESLERARREMANHIRSEEFIRLLMGGGDGEPASEVNWPETGIVKLLRAAEGKAGDSGWTALSEAIAFARTNDGDETPKRYGCKTWRQVLKKSGLFEMRIEKAADGQPVSSVWYRSKLGPRLNA